MKQTGIFSFPPVSYLSVWFGKLEPAVWGLLTRYLKDWRKAHSLWSEGLVCRETSKKGGWKSHTWEINVWKQWFLTFQLKISYLSYECSYEPFIYGYNACAVFLFCYQNAQNISFSGKKKVLWATLSGDSLYTPQGRVWIYLHSTAKTELSWIIIEVTSTNLSQDFLITLQCKIVLD